MASAERGMSAPPEVVFNTAVDPNRMSAWLPEPLRAGGRPATEVRRAELTACWRATGDWTAQIRVDPADAGGAWIRLDLTGGTADRLVDEALADLARAVDDNLQAG
ncbi:hypothetical protein [Salinispora tropica]|uniref:SRPBCC family protein n=1 Tax=Salinispora tropica (strain ATCC BAA-916 / DSM 44818 / JCM 13857 / NBRC 105044 / CNB-440) TaxID=369723 RepID=A4XAQ7_SALTO|nr:hypothetical protein [Salinispora tropica]ABP56006.1 hypothetical protein Strop_3575 [Salinispora tropica CNB-440]